MYVKSCVCVSSDLGPSPFSSFLPTSPPLSILEPSVLDVLPAPRLERLDVESLQSPDSFLSADALLAVGEEERGDLCGGCDPECMSPARRVWPPVVKGSRVVDDGVVPEDQSVGLPSHPQCKVGVDVHQAVEHVEDGVRLALGYTNDVTSEGRVDVDALPASDRVGSHKRVLRLDGTATQVEAGLGCSFRLLYTRVEGSECLEVLSHGWREGIVESVAG